ncbi:MAG: HEAT repeat domain-containing protein [Halobacteriales archaeon]
MPDETPGDGPTDPRVHPEASPGFGSDLEGLADIDVGRDVTLGEADPRELQATDVAPLADASTAETVRNLHEGDVVERRRAALALGDHPATDGVVGTLVEVGLTDDDADVRQFAVESLGTLGGARAEEGAVASLADSNPWVRAEAVVALDRIDRGRFEDRLEAALADDHHAVRRNAAISLFKWRGPALLEELLALTHDDSERVREWAAHLLAGVDDPRAEARLRELAADPDEPSVVSSTAARSLRADPGTFRRQFTGGLENDGADDPSKSRLNRQPDL